MPALALWIAALIVAQGAHAVSDDDRLDDLPPGTIIETAKDIKIAADDLFPDLSKRGPDGSYLDGNCWVTVERSREEYNR